MTYKPVLHFIDPDTRSRAELARLGFALGHHCEVYAEVGELAQCSPRSGIILARDSSRMGSIGEILVQLGSLGIWLPLIAFDDDPQPRAIVNAIKVGALDYLPFPLETVRLERCLTRVAEEAEEFARARRRMIEARSRIATLSGREREVLEWLAEGSSNKAIARELSISPRTVEIHRANMMSKLGASHPAEAVRLRLEAGNEPDTETRKAG